MIDYSHYRAATTTFPLGGTVDVHRGGCGVTEPKGWKCQNNLSKNLKNHQRGQ